MQSLDSQPTSPIADLPLFSNKPDTDRLQSFLQAAANIVGTDYVKSSEADIGLYARSCSNASVPSLAIVLPASVSDVQELLKLASRIGIKVYPISRGCNWGLGDACPTTEGQVILDLQRLNRITTEDAELGAFTVEPGVTQKQMFEYLRDNGLPFWYDASGAGPSTSLIGNLMERGYGHTPLGERFQNTCNYQVVLADGTLLHTGFGEVENCRVKHLFKPGLGPSLDGLFTQSNLGIVTRATFWMMPIPEHFEAYAFQMDSNSQLEEAIEALRPLRASGALASALHIGNDFRMISGKTQYPYDQLNGAEPFPQALRKKMQRQYGARDWNALGAYYGTKIGVRAFRRELRKALRGIASPIFLTERKLKLGHSVASVLGDWLPLQGLKSKLSSAESVMALLRGEPVADHLLGASWRSRKKWQRSHPSPIQRGDGLIWYTPLLPCKAADIRNVQATIADSFEQSNLEPLVTYVLISSRTLVCPITIAYDQHSETQLQSARECLERLRSGLNSSGYHPYRSASAPSNQVGILKQALDPRRVIAPGRYGVGHCPKKNGAEKFCTVG